MLLSLPKVPASRNEYYSIKQQLEVESFPGEKPGDPSRSFHHLPKVEQARLERKRLAGKEEERGGEGRGEEIRVERRGEEEGRGERKRGERG